MNALSNQPLLLEFKPSGYPIFITQYTQQYNAENKQYILSTPAENSKKFCGHAFVEVACELEKMAKFINYYVGKYGYTFNTKALSGTRPLLYNKMKRFFTETTENSCDHPSTIEDCRRVWNGETLTRVVIKTVDEFKKKLRKKANRNVDSRNREQKAAAAKTAILSFLEG